MSEHPYGWLSLLPPVAAIVLAIATRRIILSLVVGIFAGALLMSGGNVLVAVLQTWEVHLWQTLIEPNKMRVFSFTLLMGAIVGVITQSGGMQGLIDLVSPWARTRRRGQLATWVLGMLIFFDDYANTILLGNTLRPICDRLKISREKLAYLVDSTAAPVAGLALVSTWVAIEIEYIADGLAAISAPNQLRAFDLFVASIPYRFYVWAALFLVPMTAVLQRDFGPMLRAERRRLADTQGDDGESEHEADSVPRASGWHNAVLPIGVTLLFVLYFIYTTGSKSVCEARAGSAIAAAEPLASSSDAVSNLIDRVAAAAESADLSATSVAIEELARQIQTVASEEDVSLDPNAFQSQVSMRDIVGQADSALALQYGSLIGLLLAMAMPWSQRLMSGSELLRAAADGAAIILPAVVILWCASTMSRMTTDTSVAGDSSATPYQFKDHRLYTAAFFTQLLSEGNSAAVSERGSAAGYSVELLPTTVFLLAAAVAFCTGTSWGTMGILLPMIVPLAHALLAREGAGGMVAASNPILLSSVGGVLAGSIFGDHCSPISDTTVLSSQSSGCDHLAHVWTQLPYATVAAIVSVLLGTLPLGFGVPLWVLLPLQIGCLAAILLVLGKTVQESS